MKGTKLLILVFLTATVTCSPLRRDEKREPITISAGASVAQMSLDELITAADLIVIGEFAYMQLSRWSTPDGELPADATIETISQQHLIIFTDIVLESSQVLKGEIKSPTVRIRTFGGQVGQDRMIVGAEPAFETGKTYLLFLSPDSGSTADIDPGDYLIRGGHQGVYEITGDKAVSVSDEWLLEDLINYIQKSIQSAQWTVPSCSSPFGPNFDGPFGNGEIVSLAQAQAMTSYTIPLPEAVEVKQVWISTHLDPLEQSVAIQFIDDLQLIIHEASRSPNWDGIIPSAPFVEISVNGNAGSGADPGTNKIQGKEYCYPGSVNWWVDGLDISLYSYTLELEELLKISQTVH